MFKYIKKLTSVVVMFAVIIVFSSSKVYAGSAFSMPRNVEKAAEVVGIVNDIATLTGITLKSRQDVDANKVKVDKGTFKKLRIIVGASVTILGIDAKIAELNTKVVNMVTLTACRHFFSPTDVKKLYSFTTPIMDVDINKTNRLDVDHYNIPTNKISPINILHREAKYVNNIYMLSQLRANMGNKYYEAKEEFDVWKSFDGVETYEFDADYVDGKLQLKANNGKYYDAKIEDGNFLLTTAGLAKFKIDKEEANDSGNSDSGGSESM